jgi:hypothetical protein
VLRAGGGNSTTTTQAAAAASGGGAGGAGAARRPASPAATLTSASTSSPADGAGGGGGGVRHFVLSDVLARASAAGDPSIRTTVCGLYRSLIPLLTPQQLRDPFLPALRRLCADKDPGVVRAAVRALATVYSSPALVAAQSEGGSAAADADDEDGAAGGGGLRGEINAEVARLLGAGPREVIVEILRSLMRAVPAAPPQLRDGFILDRLLEMAGALATASEAGTEVCARARVHACARARVRACARARVRACARGRVASARWWCSVLWRTHTRG